MDTKQGVTGAKIKRARQIAGLTQADAAKAAGVPLSSFQAYEQGKVTPPYGRVETILAVLSKDMVISELNTSAEDIFYLVLSMNDQPFYRFRCIGETLGDVQYNIDVDASLLKMTKEPAL